MTTPVVDGGGRGAWYTVGKGPNYKVTTPVVDGGGRGGAALVLGLLLAFATLTVWMEDRWPASLFEAGALALAGALVIRRCREGPSAAALAPALLLSGCAAWGVAQWVGGVSVAGWRTLEAALEFLAWAAVYGSARESLEPARLRRKFLKAAAGFGGGVAALALAQLASSGGRVFWRFPTGYPDVFGPFVYHNQYAAFMELLLPIAMFLGLGRQRLAPAALAAAGLMAASVVASASRAGLALTALEVALVPALAALRCRGARRRAPAAVGLVVLAAGGFTVAAGWERLAGRLREPDPLGHRREMLFSSLALAAERPAAGFGLGTYQLAYPAQARFDNGFFVNHAHNEWAQWAVEGGLPVLAAMAAVAALSAPAAVRSVWGIGAVAVWIHALVDYPFRRMGLAAWVFALLGACAAEAAAERGKKR